VYPKRSWPLMAVSLVACRGEALVIGSNMGEVLDAAEEAPCTDLLRIAGEFGTGAVPLSVVVGDLNGDGKPDLVVSNNVSQSVSVLLGVGDGTFQTAVAHPVPRGATMAAIGDLNGDGKLDVAVTGGVLNTVTVLLGNGDGTFQTPVAYGAGQSPWGVAIFDLNADRHADLVVANMFAGGPGFDADSGDAADLGIHGAATVLLGNGDGTFREPVSHRTGMGSVALAIGDLDADGKPDLAVANQDNDNLSVLLGRGDGTFEPQVPFPTGVGPNSVAIADLNGDGNVDLAVANGGSSEVGVLFGKGDGTFQPQVEYGALADPVSITIDDFNGDGKSDLVVANNGTGNGSMLLGKGGGTFRMQMAFPIGTYPNMFPDSLAVADLNRDGKPDLAIANSAVNNVSVLLGGCDHD
jgi:hypothetical protein